MLYLNPNKEKVLTFEVELSGASANDIKGFVRFIVDGVEIGFPAMIKESEIKAVISPLKNFLKNPLKNGTVFEAQLDLYTEDQEYFSPWKGEIEVKMPVTIEAKLAEDGKGSSGKFGVKAKIISESDKGIKKGIKTKSKIIKEDKREVLKSKLKNITEEQIYAYMERAGATNPKVQKLIFEQANMNAKSNLDVLKNVIKIFKKKR